MRGSTAGEALHRQLLVVTLALVSGMVIFGAVVAGMGLTGAGASTASGAPLRLGAAVYGLVVLAVAQFVGPAVGRAPSGTGIDERATRLQSGVIVGQALRESAGLVGGVVGFVTGDLLLMTVLIAAAAVTMLLGLPGRDEIERLLRGGGSAP